MHASGPGMPGHPGQSYAYPMHPGPYPHPGYGYPHYPQPMVMYAPPRQNAPPDVLPPTSPVLQSASAGGKRKRKSNADAGRSKGDKGSDEEASGSDMRSQTAAQQAQALVDLKKRTKTVGCPQFNSSFRLFIRLL